MNPGSDCRLVDINELAKLIDLQVNLFFFVFQLFDEFVQALLPR